jgi:hypothetical protein
LKFSLFEGLFELALGWIKRQNLIQICRFSLFYESFLIQMNEWFLIHSVCVGIVMQANTVDYLLR